MFSIKLILMKYMWIMEVSHKLSLPTKKLSSMPSHDRLNAGVDGLISWVVMSLFFAFNRFGKRKAVVGDVRCWNV